MKKAIKMTNNDSTVDTLILKFSKELKSNGHEELVPSVASRFSQIFSKRKRKGMLVTAIPLDEKKIGEITDMVFNKFHKTIQFENVVEKSIIGGIIIRFGDVVIDESVSKYLTAIKQNVYEYR